MGDVIRLNARKQCSECEKAYPATTEHFRSNGSTWDGLSLRCIHCLERRKQERESEKGERDRKFAEQIQAERERETARQGLIEAMEEKLAPLKADATTSRWLATLLVFCEEKGVAKIWKPERVFGTSINVPFGVQERIRIRLHDAGLIHVTHGEYSCSVEPNQERLQYCLDNGIALSQLLHPTDPSCADNCTFMPWGKYSGKPLSEISASYLAWCFESAPYIPPTLKAAIREELLNRLNADRLTDRQRATTES